MGPDSGQIIGLELESNRGVIRFDGIALGADLIDAL
jgi:hypothetical protein